ncbi:MAG: NAD(P)-binding domain-containing protein, partial [Agromyces sp.]
MSAEAPVRLPAIAFLGAGSMARAILTGLLQPGIEVDGGIRATNRSAEKAAELAALPGVVAYAT